MQVSREEEIVSYLLELHAGNSKQIPGKNEVIEGVKMGAEFRTKVYNQLFWLWVYILKGL
jgi:hypothetical protein